MRLDLEPKERMSLLLGLFTFVIALGLALYIPGGPKRDYDLARDRLQNLQNDLILAHTTRDEEEARLQSQQVLKERLAAREPNFELLSYIESKLNESNLRDRAQYEYFRSRNAVAAQPMVDLRLSNVGLQELLDFLHSLYASDKLIAMYKLDSLGPANNRQGLDCAITLMTLKV